MYTRRDNPAYRRALELATLAFGLPTAGLLSA